MKKMSKITLLIIAMMLTMVLTIYITFAWFDLTKETKPIIINTGSLRLDSKLFFGIDTNYDGVLDDNQYTEVTEGGIEFTNVTPGQIYTFKMFVQNKGTIPGELSITINDLTYVDQDILQGFSLEYKNPQTQEVVIKGFDEAVDNDLMMVDKFLLDKQEIIEIDFQIRITSKVGNNNQNEKLIITNYVITLNQTQ